MESIIRPRAKDGGVSASVDDQGGPPRFPAHPSPWAASLGEESPPVPWQYISGKKPQARGFCLILYSEHPFLSIQEILKLH